MVLVYGETNLNSSSRSPCIEARPNGLLVTLKFFKYEQIHNAYMLAKRPKGYR